MSRGLLLLAALGAVACASQPTAPPSSAVAAVCSLPDGDRAWIDRAVEAWRFTSREITGIARVPGFRAILFSADCVMTSENALSSAAGEPVVWTAARHAGEIALPDGSSLPVGGPVSFTSGEKGDNYFVMSTPSVWQAAGVGEGEELERKMVAVLLHEASHIAQILPYGPRLGTLIEANHLPDEFNDDSLQQRFGEDAEFTASVQRETQLFLEAAAAKDDAEAKRLASEARGLMRARKARWMVGADAYFAEAEDIWLTFEGAGQWAGYQWLTHPRGGGQSPEAAQAAFTRGRWWSQTEGFALFMALDRVVDPAWKRHVYGDGKLTALEILDASLDGRFPG